MKNANYVKSSVVWFYTFASMNATFLITSFAVHHTVIVQSLHHTVIVQLLHHSVMIQSLHHTVIVKSLHDCILSIYDILV